jgi:hypothetical protein
MLIGSKKPIQNFCWKISGSEILGSPRHRWDDNIKIDVREIGCTDVKLNQVVQGMIQW